MASDSAPRVDSNIQRFGVPSPAANYSAPRLCRIDLPAPIAGSLLAISESYRPILYFWDPGRLFSRDANPGVSDDHPGLCVLISSAIIECPLSVELRPLVLQEPTLPARSSTSAYDPKRNKFSVP